MKYYYNENGQKQYICKLLNKTNVLKETKTIYYKDIYEEYPLPTMTSNTTPEGTVSYQVTVGQYANALPHVLFWNNSSYYYINSYSNRNKTAWFQYTFENPIKEGIYTFSLDSKREKSAIINSSNVILYFEDGSSSTVANITIPVGTWDSSDFYSSSHTFESLKRIKAIRLQINFGNCSSSYYGLWLLNLKLQRDGGLYKYIETVESTEDDSDYEETKYYKWIPFEQPVLTSNTSHEGIVLSASDLVERAWKALNGITYVPEQTSDYLKEDGWVSGDSSTGWWQVKFPYKLRIKKLTHWTNSLYYNDICNLTGRFYTSSDKSTPLGNQFTCSKYSGTSLDISVDSIITDTIYFEKTSGHTWNGIGELVIDADVLIETDSSDYDYEISMITEKYSKEVTKYKIYSA